MQYVAAMLEVNVSSDCLNCFLLKSSHEKLVCSKLTFLIFLNFTQALISSAQLLTKKL